MTTLYPGCKLNFGLKILSRLPEGFHSLETIFFPLPFPRDELILEETGRKSLALECDRAMDGVNILNKAYNVFCAFSGEKPGVRAILKKRIPVGAGLGGGSSDAASFLLWLNKICGNPLGKRELVCAAKQTGADAPFFIINSPAKASGIGAILEPLDFLAPAFYIILIWPEIQMHTKIMFESLDKAGLTPRNKGLTNSGAANIKIYANSLECIDFANDFEAVAFQSHPLLKNIKELLYKLGAFRSAMSGSGSSIYGLFYGLDGAKKAAAKLRERFKFVYLVAVPRSDG